LVNISIINLKFLTYPQHTVLISVINRAGKNMHARSLWFNLWFKTFWFT